MNRFRIWAGVLLLALTGSAQASASVVTSGSELDYMPAVMRAGNGDILVVYERLGASLFGDLWMTRSSDAGDSWSTPAAVISSSANERHPALVGDGAGGLILFYLKGTGATSTYRLFRATSADGSTFVEQGMLNLGWASGGEVNPHVIRHANGTLTLSYHRLGGSSYVAQSSDNGVSWDQLKTAIAPGTSQLPRIVLRESDQRYLVSYQVGSSALRIYVKTSTNVYDWSAAAIDFAVTDDNHDSLPIVMGDGAFALFWARSDGGPYDLWVRRSSDGVNWAAALPITQSSGATDIEPHPLASASATEVDLYWGRESPSGSNDYDIVHDAHVVVQDAIFTDHFEP